MPKYTLNLEGIYMPRHPHDRMNLTKDHLRSIEQVGTNLFNAMTNRYRSPDDRWEEMDRFWAGQEAKYMIYGLPYILFMPGKYYTYFELADVVENALRDIDTPLEGAKILEDGSGSAIWSLLLGKRGAVPHLFDKSWCALEFAQFLADEDHFGVELADVGQGDFYDLPNTWKGGEGIFDAVISGAVLEHLGIEDQDKYLKEAFATLKPGGLVAFTMPNPESPLNVISDKKKQEIYKKIGELGGTYQEGGYQYTIDFPMPYNQKGGARDMATMLRDNGFVVQKAGDAVLIAPSNPLERKLIEGNEVAKRFYEKLEKMCDGGLINSTVPTGKDVGAIEALIAFWKTQSKSLTDKERNEIGRWSYAIGRKPMREG
jgi:SAM-dependent methyltransferase